MTKTCEIETCGHWNVKKLTQKILTLLNYVVKIIEMCNFFEITKVSSISLLTNDWIKMRKTKWAMLWARKAKKKHIKSPNSWYMTGIVEYCKTKYLSCWDN